MKSKRNLFLITLGVCITFIISIEPFPFARGDWNVINIYQVRNSESFQSAKFTVPANAEKIRLTFDITVDNISGSYVLLGTLRNDNNDEWKFQETQGLLKTFEFDDVTGSINLSLLLTLAHAELTVEWYETPSHLKLVVQDSEGNPISGAEVSSTSQPSSQSTLSGTTGSDGSVTFNEVSQGSYSFQASKKGYESGSISISAVKGETTEKTILLTKEASGGGIPGFSTESIIFGLLLGSFIVLISRARWV